MTMQRKMKIEDVEEIGIMLDIREYFTSKEREVLGDNIVLPLLREKI